jgi:NADH-quinone oxidoreductase subunit G
MLAHCLASRPTFLRSFAALSPAIDVTTNSLSLNRAKCVSCGLCVKACKTIAGQGVLALVAGPGGKKISTVTGLALQDTKCIKCGQCTLACGPGALAEKDQLPELEAILANPAGRTLVVSTAPAIRINLCDGLGLPAGSIGTGKMVTALKKLGFNYVFDTNFAADLTIVEEATELVSRITKGSAPLPMFTSCCPAWVNYVEQSDPSLIPNLSTCRSPLGMHSAIIKTDWAQLKGLAPAQIYNVAVMPCTAKKDEVAREQFRTRGYRETDLVITTRELVRLIKKKKINFKTLPDTDFDPCYSIGSGAGAIFCGSGGVMEAAVRTAYTFVTKKTLGALDFPALRGAKDGIKIVTADFDGTKVGVAVAQGIANAQKLIAKIKAKDPSVANVAFVEVMACPGGCVCGGGSPKAKTKKAVDARVDAVYKIDTGSAIRLSHENPEIKEFYARFGGSPNGHVAHEFLHTHYHAHSKK